MATEGPRASDVFRTARRRLALRYVVLFALALAVFSAVFFAFVAVIIQPAFDIGPEPPEGAAGRVAYTREIERIGFAVLVADVALVGVVAFAGYHLADRTLRPISDAHDRQGRFVADASHEIRSPLAVIRATVDRGLDPESDDEARTAALRTIGEAAQRLTATSNGLLELASADRQFVRAEPVDVSVAVAEAVSRARDAVGGDAVHVELSLAPDVVVLGDDESLTNLVRNLVENALRYDTRGPVTIRSSATGWQAVVEVVDRGPGIPTTDLERIFEPFYRVRADAKAPRGTGLGLAIAARLAHQLGGRLRAESTVGQGTTMRLTLPRHR